MPFIVKKKTAKPAPKPAPKKTPDPKPVKTLKVSYVDKLKPGRKPKEKPLVIAHVNEPAPAPIPERMPLDPTKIKWYPPDGAVMLVALSLLGNYLKGKTFTKEEFRWEMGTKLEALGVGAGARETDIEHVEKVAEKVFHIFGRGKDPKKVSPAVYNLVFWPQFLGGFIS